MVESLNLFQNSGHSRMCQQGAADRYPTQWMGFPWLRR